MRLGKRDVLEGCTVEALLLGSFVNSLASADPPSFIPPVLQGLQRPLCLQASLWGDGDGAKGISIPEHKLVPGELGFLICL